MPEWIELKRFLRGRFAGKSWLQKIAVFRVTILLTAIITVIGRSTAGESREEYLPKLDRYGLDWDILSSGRLWHIFTGTLLQSDAGILYSMILLLVISLGTCELAVGSRFTLITFFISDWIGTLASIFALRILSVWDISNTRELLSISDAGSSAAFHGCMAVAAALLPGRFAWGMYGLILGITIGLVVQQGLSSGIAHLVATLLGGFLGLFVWKPRLARETEQSARNYGRDALAVSGLE